MHMCVCTFLRSCPLCFYENWSFSTRLANQPHGPTCLCLFHVGITSVHHCAWIFYVDFGELNSGPHFFLPHVEKFFLTELKSKNSTFLKMLHRCLFWESCIVDTPCSGLKTVPIGSHVWMIGHQWVELMGRDLGVWPCWNKYAARGEFWGF